MKVYIQRSDGAYAAFDGMTTDQIMTMLAGQGLTASIITQEQYIAAMQAMQQ